MLFFAFSYTATVAAIAAVQMQISLEKIMLFDEEFFRKTKKG